ncbi:MAG: choice-of-anchor D domain-containing protein, partial [Bacteroidales bacterium]|nr:choice-of-anchor D domain-containing protein [Bacteroidales bacterium]
VDTRIDNMRYWKKAAELGLVPISPVIPFKQAEPTSGKINAKSVKDENSPDVPVTNLTNVTQSENSIFVHPNDNNYSLNSNNSTSWNGGSVGSLYGANYFYSADGGQTWGGSHQGAGGSNSGDPTTAISLSGRQYVGYIHDNYGQGVSYSDNGINWTPVLVANPPSGWNNLLDKNHMWIDNSPTSQYEGNLYDAWTAFGGSNDAEIEISRSTNNGGSWSSKVNISSAVNAGSHNQGVNIQTGPNGEVYVCWSIYDSWPTDEDAIGFTKSTNGGANYQSATRIISNIRGIRNSKVSKNHRVNSFPVMAADISNGPNRGNIYIVWTNIGTPGINTGTNRSVYLIRSTDQGNTWSNPFRVNQGNFQNGKEAYFPWITCDPETGTLSVIFYDDRNTSSSSCEVYVANSFDAGNTWEDFAVSDVSFTPSPIPGLASSYMGDYLGISARGGMVYPCWTDNRGGLYMTYVSPFTTNNLERPTDLVASLNDITGQVDLTWNFNFIPGFLNFNIYRDGILIGTSSSTSFTDNLPSYGLYSYEVTAMHNEGESIPAATDVQWGDPGISVDPTSFYVTLPPDGISVEPLTITNTGELDLTFGVETVITTKGPEAYCSADGGCDEYISQVILNTINNSSGCNGYEDFTSITTTLNAGDTYDITVVNGNIWTADDLGVWIDWNQDQDFYDPGENIVCEGGNSGQGTYSFTVPNGATAGQTRMRIRIKYFGSDCGDPCGSTSYGEVEDYSINVQGWLNVNPTAGTVTPGGSQTLDVTFDATGLSEGIYTGNILVSSNDPNQPLITIPATLNVSLGNPQIAVSPSSLDFGDVQVGLTSTQQFSITNTGTGVLSGTITTPSGFSAGNTKNTISYNVNAGITEYFNLTFAPTAAQPYSGNVIIDHNAGSNPELIAVTGNGIQGPEPDITLNPDNFYIALMQNTNTDQIMTVSNIGDALLNYTTDILFDADYTGYSPKSLKLGYLQKNLETSDSEEICPNKVVGYSYPEAAGDILIDMDIESQTNDNQMLGCEFVGTYLWFTGAGDGGDNKIYRFDL